MKLYESEERVLQQLKQMYPQVSEETLKQNILRSRMERAHEACMERQKGLTMSNYNESANYPGGWNRD